MFKNNYKFNLTKFITSVLIPWIPSESLKMGSAMQIYNTTHSYWLVTTLFMLMNIPILIVQIFSKQLMKLFNFKKGLLIVDFFSAVLLIAPIIIWKLFPISTNTGLIVTILMILNMLQSFTYSIKTLYIRQMTHFISNNKAQLDIANVVFNVGVALSLIISPIFSVQVFNKITFDIFMTINLIFYLVSIVLFRTIKLNENAFVAETKQEKIVLGQSTNVVYVVTISSIAGLFLFTRQSGVIGFFNNYNYDFHFWSYYLAITMGILGLVGIIVAFLIKKTRWKINNTILLFIFFILNLSWLFISQIKNVSLSIAWFFVINAIQQFIINFINNNLGFRTQNITFAKRTIKVEKIVTLIQVTTSIIFTFLLTYVLVVSSYYHSYILYTIILLTMILLVYSYRPKV
ncbi:MFS transporter [Mycoplasma sp. OR1901]|uniref:MFS transporter n=1 Tax=Mycoplasma sp. OR1901 TaxID=2742195 RepID=UPI001582B357|nr:MFS transporter [Mycoplasma sp. OR1901]QKT05351.1 MFS transporter [Mycoplasma sp. OR1901]